MTKSILMYAPSFVGLAFFLFSVGPAKAVIYDITTEDSYVVGLGFGGGGALYSQSNESGQGSGILDPFVRSNSGQPAVFDIINTSTTLYTASTDKNPNFTHNIRYDSIPQVTVNTTDSNGNVFNTTAVEFLFDSNQINNGAISLDQFFVFSRSDSYGTGQTPNTLAGLLNDSDNTLIYNLDIPVDNAIIFSSGSGGSGQDDMYVFLPTSFFIDARVRFDDYVYIYAQFGVTAPNNDGFEEIGIDGSLPPPVIPEPSTYIFGCLLLGVLFCIEHSRLASIARKFAGQN